MQATHYSVSVKLPRTSLLMPWELDLRSVGAFRLALGLATVLQIGWRLATLEWWYGPDAFAGPQLRDAIAGFPDWSFLAGASALTIALALWACVPLAVMLALGWYGRWAAWGLAAVFFALDVHNPTFLGNEKWVMNWSLLWAGLLPIDRTFSIRRQPLTETVVSSAGALGLTLQIGLVYYMNGIYKDEDEWGSGRALRNIVERGMYNRPPFDQIFLVLPDWVQRLLTGGIFYLERLAVPLLLIPLQWVRLLTVLALMAFHVSSVIAINAGLYPLMSLIWLTALLPPMVWREKPATKPLFVWKTGSSVLATFILLYVVWVNIAGAMGGVGQSSKTTLQALGVYQTWGNFTASTFTVGVPVFEAKTAQGSVDLYRWAVTGDGPQVSKSLPSDFNRAYGGRWWNWFSEPHRKVIVNLVESHKPDAFAAPARFLCRKWNAAYPAQQVSAVEVTFVTPKGQQKLWAGSCLPNP